MNIYQIVIVKTKTETNNFEYKYTTFTVTSVEDCIFTESKDKLIEFILDDLNNLVVVP